jgi:hypothetical protein
MIAFTKVRFASGLAFDCTKSSCTHVRLPHKLTTNPYRKQDISHPRSRLCGELGRHYGKQLDKVLRRGSWRHTREATQNGS